MDTQAHVSILFFVILLKDDKTLPTAARIFYFLFFLEVNYNLRVLYICNIALENN